MDFVAKGLVKEIFSTKHVIQTEIPDNQAKGWRKVREDVSKAVVPD